MKKSDSVCWQFYAKCVSGWRKIAVFPIRVYQHTLSFDHGLLRIFAPHGACPFYPTCSEYMVRAVLRYGVVRGGMRGCWRLCRCHPWTHGGIDHP